MNTEHLLEISITVRGPILVKSSSPGDFGLDAAASRVAYGPRRGNPCIPGTLIKGKLAEAFAQFAHVDPGFEAFAEHWLGKDGGNPDSLRGRVLFEDFVAANKGRSGVRHRISIDDTLGSVCEEMLQVIEMPFEPGEEIVFKGCARFLADSVSVMDVERNIRLGLGWMTQIGANRTVGFGRVLGLRVDRVPGRSVKAIHTSGASPAGLDLSIRPLGPLCVSKHKIDGNLFESENFIPGNVLAGSIAETWAALIGERVPPKGVIHFEAKDPARAALAQNFELIRFRHAFPAGTETAERPSVVPHSVVKGAKPKSCSEGKTTSFRDVVDCSEPVVFRLSKGLAAPTFRTDWKNEDFGEVDSKFGWVFPATELRVRTAIDSIKRRADRGEKSGTPEPEGKLFAWEVVHPFTPDQTPVVWRSRIDLMKVAEKDRADVARQLSGLLSTLSFTSKTKVACNVTCIPVPETGQPPVSGTLRLVLQTPALLCDPRFQPPVDNTSVKTSAGADVPTSGALNNEELHAVYASVWEELSGNSLELTHFFASQSLAGGEYLFHRFQKKTGKGYRPWLLTDAGSVFAFKVNDPISAVARLKLWLSEGLSPPKWVKREFGDRWDQNPYLPSNGFGEIAVHKAHLFTPLAANEEIEILGESKEGC